MTFNEVKPFLLSGFKIGVTGEIARWFLVNGDLYSEIGGNWSRSALTINDFNEINHAKFFVEDVDDIDMLTYGQAKQLHDNGFDIYLSENCRDIFNTLFETLRGPIKNMKMFDKYWKKLGKIFYRTSGIQKELNVYTFNEVKPFLLSGFKIGLDSSHGMWYMKDNQIYFEVFEGSVPSRYNLDNFDQGENDYFVEDVDDIEMLTYEQAKRLHDNGFDIYLGKNDLQNGRSFLTTHHGGVIINLEEFNEFWEKKQKIFYRTSGIQNKLPVDKQLYTFEEIRPFFLAGFEITKATSPVNNYFLKDNNVYAKNKKTGEIAINGLHVQSVLCAEALHPNRKIFSIVGVDDIEKLTEKQAVQLHNAGFAVNVMMPHINQTVYHLCGDLTNEPNFKLTKHRLLGGYTVYAAISDTVLPEISGFMFFRMIGNKLHKFCKIHKRFEISEFITIELLEKEFNDIRWDHVAFSLFESEMSIGVDVAEQDNINHPPHYINDNIRCKNCDEIIECIDVAENFDFNIGNAMKYLWRAGKKDDFTDDLKKAKWYIENAIEREEGEN